MNRTLLLTACALSALMSTAMGGTALAQATANTTSASSGDQVETVVVTAEKRSQRLIDVPASISVVTAKDMQDESFVALSDISTRMPNVQITGSSLYPAITIRGVSSVVSGGNPGFAPAAAVYVDDVYQGRDRATNIPTSGISQIEVLRGPQGTLYGKDTIAGAINISTLRPSDDFIAFGDAQYGNLNFQQFTGTVSGPTGIDGLDASVSGVYRHRDGWIHNAFDGDNLNFDNAVGGRARAIYTANSKLTFDFGLDYLSEQDSESDLTTDYSTLEQLQTLAGLGFLPAYLLNAKIFDPTTRTESVNSPEYGRRTVQGASGRMDYDFGDVRFTSISAVRGYTSASGFDTDGTSLNMDHETWVNNAHQFSQEFRLTSTDAGPFQWIAGAYYYNESEYSDFFLDIGDQFPGFLLGFPALPPGFTDYDEAKDRVEESSIAGFLSGTYAITSNLKFAAGVRFTQDAKTLHVFQLPEAGVTPNIAQDLLATIPPRTQGINEDEPSYDASLTYEFTPDQVGYLKFSRGYKAGGFNLFGITPPFNASESLAFKPEFLNNYEAGYKASFWDGKLNVNAAVFYDDYTNKQEQVEDITTFEIIVVNAARATIYGSELELDAMPIDGLTLSGTLGLLHGTYASFPNAGVATPCDCFTGNDIANAPQLEYSLAAEYEHSIPGWDGYSAFARIELNHQSHSFTDPNNSIEFESKPYDLLNSRVGIEADHWGIYLWGRNLTNTFHLGGGFDALVTDARGVNIPRTYGVELTLKN